MSIPGTPEQTFLRLKQQAEETYAREIEAARQMRGGNAVRQRAVKAAGERLRQAYADANLVALFATNPILIAAEASLRAFGDVDRATAETLLSMWTHVPELTARERRALLLRFPVAENAARPVKRPPIESDEWDDHADPVPPAHFFNGGGINGGLR